MARKKTKRTNDKAVIYSRFSPRRNAEDCEGCERQTEICRNYCKFNNLKVMGEFKDEALSGKLSANREGLQKAMSAAKQHKAVLVFYSLSRFARNTRETLDLADELQKAGAGLCSVTEKIDTTSYMGRFFFRLLAIMAEMEREQISERTSDIMQQHQASGRRMSFRLPYGMANDPDDPRRMVKNPYEQKVIRRIIKLKEKKLSLRATCAKLNEEGIKPRQQKKKFKGRTVYCKGKWNHKLISNILTRAGIE